MDHLLLNPKKSLGQNFLTDENIARKIIAALELTDRDRVLEIGAGTGVLTKYLVERARQVIAVEIDRKLMEQLRHRFGAVKHLRLFEADILKISWDQMLEGGNNWKAVANLPYHITSPVLFRFFDHFQHFDSATLMLQKEVAQRLNARPGSKSYGILSVLSQFYAEVQLLFDVSRHVFFPKPQVTSSVVRLKFKRELEFDLSQEQFFRQLVRGTFNQRRKILRNSLAAIPDLSIDINALNFDLSRRPEQLSLSEFIEISRQVADQILNRAPAGEND